MNKRAKISLIVALLMIVSTTSVGTGMITASETCPGGEPAEPGVGLTVVKTIWDGACWTDPIDANIGEDVRFNISITYNPVDLDPNDGDGVGYKAKNLLVKDTLPDCLEYNNHLVITHGENVYTTDLAEIDGKIYRWYLTRDYGIELYDNDPSKPRTVYLEFNATVVSDGENVNHVNVTGFETCGQEDLYDEDTATVCVPCQGEPAIDVEKKAWDEDLEEWVDGPITAYEGDQITFYINISNIGNVALHNVIVTDVVPDFLTGSGTHSSNIGTLNAGEFHYEEFTENVEDIHEVLTGENYVNATADEDVFDEDEVEITVKPHFILEKEVWNGTGWAEFKESVTIGETVKFKITATYYGEDLMKCLVIGDFLPEVCLEYADNEKIWIAGTQIFEGNSMWPDIYSSEGELIEICNDITFELPENVIVWDWRNAMFGLEDGETVVIEFSTTVTEYCEECEPTGQPCVCQCQEVVPMMCINPNCAGGLIWGCMHCSPCCGYKDFDCAFVRCCPPPTTFTKKVWDDGEWSDSIDTVDGSTIKFKLELNYYGNEKLVDVNFKDVLPCILDYANNVDITVTCGNSVCDQEPEISSDGKTLWWNLTNVNLTDSGKIIITFDVTVDGTTESGCCSCEPLECINWAQVEAFYYCPPEMADGFPMEDTVTITARGNCPPAPEGISGPSSGKVDEELTFKSKITDPDGDNVLYKFKVNGDETGWLGPVSSGTEVTYKYTFEEEGTYTIKVKAKDEYGLESNWDVSLDIEITKEKSKNINRFIEMIQNTFIYQLIQKLLEKFPVLTTILNI